MVGPGPLLDAVIDAGANLIYYAGDIMDLSVRWRELLDGAGIQRASVSASGIFKDAASDELVRAAFFAGAVTDCQLVIPDFGTIEGGFQITALDYAGNHDGEVTFDIALESGSALTFGAA